MKKQIILLTVVTLFSAATWAQEVTFGIKAGVQQSALAISDDEGTNASVTGIGLIAGGEADIMFSDNFSVRPNLLFSFKNTDGLGGGDVSMLAIEVPVNLLYRTEGFFVGLGPNFSYGLSAKSKPETGDDVDLYEEDPVSGNAALKRFEVGVNGLMGYHFPGGFTLSANYTTGLSDISGEDGGDTKINTRMVGLSVGYTF